MSEAKTMSRDLTQGNVFSQLIRFAVPLMAANLLQIVYTLVDMVIVGRFVGSAGISAVATGGEILGLFTTFSMGLCGAGQVIISQYLGKGDRKGISKTIGTMFSFISLFSLCLMVIALLITNWLIGILNTPAEAVSMAKDYTKVCFLGLFFIFGYNSVSAMLRGMGDSKRPLIFIGIATISNIIMDILFVGVLKMSAFGAALATVIGQALSFLFSLVYLYRKKEAFGFDFKPVSFKIDGSVLGNLIKIGIPMALNNIAVTLSGFYVSSLVNTYGLAASAVAGIGGKIRMIIAIFSNSFATASSTMVGQSLGKGLYDRIKKTYLCTFLILLVLCGSLGILGVAFPKAFFRLFDNNPDVLDMAPKFMFINVFTCLAFALMVPGTALINGIGFARLAFITGLIDGVVVRISLVWLFYNVFQFGLWGVWWAATLAAYANALITISYFLSGRWRKRTVVVK